MASLTRLHIVSLKDYNKHVRYMLSFGPSENYFGFLLPWGVPSGCSLVCPFECVSMHLWLEA